jgi:predicted house-cleaning noncanonical NTP pyrophosphatase (MazG superfamily)
MSEKLIRDKLPELVLKERNEVLNTRIADESEMLSFLKQKIVEEANEVFNAKNNSELAEELADLLEVIRALSTKQKIVGSVFLKREEKHSERGGFEKGIILKK